MRTGKIDSGNFDVLPSVVYDSSEIGAAVTSITVSGLDGNSAGEYEIICRLISGSASAPNFYMTINNDTGSTYGYQRLRGANTSVSATRAAITNIALGTSDGLDDISLATVKLYAPTGFVRTAIVKRAMDIKSTTVTYMDLAGYSWNNTVDNITRMDFIADQTNGIGIGSRIIILRRNASGIGLRTGTLNVQGTVKGAWQRIYSNTLGSPATSVTIPSLNGNTDVLYRLKVREVGGATSSRPRYTFNADTGTNYGYQHCYGEGNGVAASRTTGANYINLDENIADTGAIIQQDILIYAKSGYLRTLISESISGISTTTVLNVNLAGAVWSDTAANITSIVIGNNATNGLGTGTSIILERLNL